MMRNLNVILQGCKTLLYSFNFWGILKYDDREEQTQQTGGIRSES
jgi:hypothetical protein